MRCTVAVVALVIVALVRVSEAQDNICWTMTPFDDELRVYPFPVDAQLGFYSIGVQWWGLNYYAIEGGGTGEVSSDGRRASMTWTFYNHTDFGSRNRMGTVKASISLVTMCGPWSLTIIGDGSGTNGSGTPYMISGTLVPKPCSRLGDAGSTQTPNLTLAPWEY
jgi:hypothetical protein